VENLQGRKGTLGRPKRRWKDNIRMGRRIIGWEVVDWTHLPQVPVAGSYEHGNETSGLVS